MASDYYNIYVIDLDTDDYTEYSSQVGGVEYSSSEEYDSLGAAKSGDDFFSQAYIDIGRYCYEPDQEHLRERLTKEHVLDAVRESGSYSINYRLVINRVPRPVTLKAVLLSEKGEEKLVVSVRAWKDRK